MNRVMIIDDEPWIVDGVKKLIDWETEGFFIVGEAMDAVEGLEKIELLKPDIVFVDIRMPEISGLELIGKVKEKKLDVTFIILSGYSEFSYAKEGITYGVFDYILKPIEKEKFIACIKRLKDYMILKAKNIKITNSEVINQLSNWNLSKDSIRNCLADLGFNNIFPFTKVLFAKYDGQLKVNINNPNIQFALLPITVNRIFIIINYFNLKDDEIYEILSKSLDGNMYMGLSSKVTEIEKIGNAFEESEIAYSYYFIYQKYGIYNYKKPEYLAIAGMVNSVIDNLKYADFKHVYKYIDNLNQTLIHNKMGMEELVFIYNSILLAVLGMQTSDDLSNSEFISYESILYDYSDFYDFVRQFKSILMKLEDEKISKNTEIYNASIKDIIEYINTHFDNEIYLKDIAKEFYINPNYLSIIFKKFFGKTFTQYLTELRMNKACKLISNSELSLEDICSLTGYSDYYNFNKAFKKYIGIPPGKYKKRIALK